MLILLIPAAILTLVTFVLAVLYRGVLALMKRRAPGFWRRTLVAHAGLFALHLFVVVPLLLGLLPGRMVGTRPDERAYKGPRLAADGSWTLQTRESLAAEKNGGASVDPATVAAAEAHAVALTAQDGVKLRAFLVPPAQGEPRFGAVVVHGLYRGALEIETPGSMLRELGGEVLLVELRNHGGSARAPATYGRDEALDVLAGAAFLKARPELAGKPLVLYAVSLGTAAAALAAPRIEGLSALVFDAPMDDLRETALREMRSGPPSFSIRFPWAQTILWSARILGGVPLDAVQPRQALAQLPPSVWVLFIGAGRDDRMPPDTVRALFEGLPQAKERKQLWIDDEATHGKVWVRAPDEYRRRLAGFISRAISE
jgi:dienelactone hydrolase